MGFYGICFARGGDECLVMSGMKGKATVRTGTRNRGGGGGGMGESGLVICWTGSLWFRVQFACREDRPGLRNTEEAWIDSEHP